MADFLYENFQRIAVFMRAVGEGEYIGRPTHPIWKSDMTITLR